VEGPIFFSLGALSTAAKTLSKNFEEERISSESTSSPASSQITLIALFTFSLMILLSIFFQPRSGFRQ
jgi:hypothetical protein